MRILITGVAGFIGSHLAERLLARGDEVVGIDNFDPFYDHRIKQRNIEGILSEKRFAFYQEDIRDTEALADFWPKRCAGIDAVAHIAAKAGVRPSIEDPLGYEQTNLMGTVNLLNLASNETTPPRFIFASSSSVYGNNPKVPFCETDNVDHPISPYAATKKSGELLCHTFHHLYGLPITTLRFFTVFGPRQRPDLAIHKFTARILGDEPIQMFGRGASRRDYTYIDDILDGVVAAIDRCEGFEIINLGSEHPVELSRMIETIESACGKKARIEKLPAQPGDVEQTFADVDKARRLLDYAPSMDFAEGVGRFVDWYKRRFA